jgi:hypothetical protein
MVQTAFDFNGRFWPISHPLFQGSRRRGRESESSVFKVVSFEADPFHLSAKLPSTGWVAYPRKTILFLHKRVLIMGGASDRIEPGSKPARGNSLVAEEFCPARPGAGVTVHCPGR